MQRQTIVLISSFLMTLRQQNSHLNNIQFQCLHGSNYVNPQKSQNPENKPYENFQPLTTALNIKRYIQKHRLIMLTVSLTSTNGFHTESFQFPQNLSSSTAFHPHKLEKNMNMCFPTASVDEQKKISVKWGAYSRELEAQIRETLDGVPTHHIALTH